MCVGVWVCVFMLASPKSGQRRNGDRSVFLARLSTKSGTWLGYVEVRSQAFQKHCSKHLMARWFCRRFVGKEGLTMFFKKVLKSWSNFLLKLFGCRDLVVKARAAVKTATVKGVMHIDLAVAGRALRCVQYFIHHSWVQLNKHLLKDETGKSQKVEFKGKIKYNKVNHCWKSFGDDVMAKSFGGAVTSVALALGHL